MRASVAIIAAVMSVTTGGPLRCPCQLAALFPGNQFPPGAACDTEAYPAIPAENEKHCCSCIKHHEPERPAPTKPTQAPDAPCEHGLGADLVPLVANGERVAGDLNPGDPVFALAGRSYPFLKASVQPVAIPTLSGSLSGHPDQLRYCHAFRC